MLEDCTKRKLICNGLISYVHLISEPCIMLLFNFARTSKKLIMKLEIKP